MTLQKQRLRTWARCCLLLAIVATVAVLAPAATAMAQEEAGAAPEGNRSVLLWLIEVSGIIGGFIFLLSFYFVAVVVQQFLELRESVAAPPEILSECDRLLSERNIQELYNVLRADESYFSKTLTVGITELQHGVDEAREKLERQADALTVDMEKRISILAVLGTLGPMIGLLGTLKGMITAFSVIAISGVALKPSEVAGGISEALVLTFEGVALSVPAIYFYAMFRNRVSTISVKTTLLADDYLRSIARLAKPRPATS